MNLVHQDIQADVANSLLAHYDKSVEKMLPYWSFGSNETWCMIGYHAAAVLADMIVKDVKGFDHERAFKAMVTTAMNNHYDCLPEYRQLGYVPFDKEAESVSKTLEYAYDDYAIAQAALKLGHKREYEYFLNRAMSYQNLLDPNTKYMRGRDMEGNWRTPFAPVAYQGPGSVNGWGDITEGFTVQYHWTVPQDVQGLINLMGRDMFKARLDSLFQYELPEDIPGAHDIQGPSEPTGTATNHATTSLTYTTILVRDGNARSGCATSSTASTATSPARSAATTTADRCRHGIYSTAWDSIPYVLRAASITSLRRHCLPST